MKIACLQINPKEDIFKNKEFVFQKIKNVCDTHHPDVVVLPEMFLFMGNSNQLIQYGQEIQEGIFLECAKWSRQFQIYLVAGSLPEKISETDKKVKNTCVTYSPKGEMLSIYRKVHLFNLFLSNGEKKYCESDTMISGDIPKPFQIKIGEKIWNALTIICYDLRFPEIIRNLKTEIDVLFVVAAFTYQTGKDHWEVLLRARAIENQCYVVACNQTGYFSGGEKRNYGHSMIIDPWGKVIVTTDEEVGVLFNNLDLHQIKETRDMLPALKDRRD